MSSNLKYSKSTQNILYPVLFFKGAILMKAVTAAAVATSAVASNISYVQPEAASGAALQLSGSLRYAQPEDAPQLLPALTSNLRSAQHASSPMSQSVFPQVGEKVEQMISKPKNAIDLTKNLKVIFDDDILLQDGFYTEANLKDIFNLEKASVIDSTSGAERHISISGSVSSLVLPRREVSQFLGGSVPGAHFVGGKKTNQAGVVTAALNFGMEEGGPDFDATQKIFAQEFVRLPPQPFSHGGPRAPMGPHGNETWRYQQLNSKTEKTITISFNSVGALSNVLIEEKIIKN